MSKKKLTDYKVLTFDCYGTLIDWETGIFAGLGPLRARLGRKTTPEQILQVYAAHESAQQLKTPSMKYSDLLAEVYKGLADEWAFAIADGEAARFGSSVPAWPAFPDSADALVYLKQHFKLVILSNVDRTSFAGSNRKLGVEFDAIYTAEDIGSYKPDRRNFEYMLSHLQSLGIPSTDVLHTAQSLFHDHVPAIEFGLATAWIDRRHGRKGWGATVPPKKLPRVDFHFKSLAELAEAHRREIQIAE